MLARSLKYSKVAASILCGVQITHSAWAIYHSLGHAQSGPSRRHASNVSRNTGKNRNSEGILSVRSRHAEVFCMKMLSVFH